VELGFPTIPASRPGNWLSKSQGTVGSAKKTMREGEADWEGSVKGEHVSDLGVDCSRRSRVFFWLGFRDPITAN
jgi:hypothetical protein